MKKFENRAQKAPVNDRQFTGKEGLQGSHKIKNF